MINFLYPSFLFAISLIAIPILIHFFNFQRAKKIYFTNVEFLHEVRAVSRSRNRLKNLLVLLCRCLAIIFLALAFAQPFTTGENAEAVNQGNHVSIYLDNSFSMQSEADNKTLFDLAVTNAEQILGLFPKNVLFQILENGFERNTRYFFDKQKVTDSLRTLTYAPSSRTFQEIYDRQAEAFQNNTSEKRNHIFWISDFRKNTSGDLSKLKIDSSNRFYLLPLQANQESNLYVDSVWLENPFVKINENNTVFVKIKHIGTKEIEDKIVKLFIENRQMSSSSISLKSNETTEIALNFAVETAGTKPCKIVLDDYPIMFDNEYFFTMRVAPPVKIVHISGSESSFIPSVYGNEPYFRLKEYSIQAVDYNELNGAGLVILQGISEIDEALKSVLINFLLKGGTLAIFPAPQIDVESYRVVVSLALANVPKAGLQRLALNPPDTQNPFFEGIFEKVDKNINMPEAQAVITWNPTGQNLLNFKNNQPFLTRLSSGLNPNSQIFLCASPLHSDFSDFPKHALFVPVMYKIALSSQTQAEKLAFSFSESIAEISLDSVRKNDIFKLVPVGEGDNPELIPNQRVTGNKLMMDIPKSGLRAGNFDVVRQKDAKKMTSIAFNYDHTESEGQNYTLEELEQLFENQPHVQIFDSMDSTEFASDFQEKNIAQNLWRWALILALVFLLAEVLLLRFWKTKPKNKA